MKAWLFYVNLPFQKEKKTWRNVALICKLPFIPQISVETNNYVTVGFLDAWLFGHPVYFDYQDFFTLD